MSGAFGKLQLSLPICKGVYKYGYEIPTAIQRKCIPVLLKNSTDDLYCTAETGSGKTCAYVLPLLQRLNTHESVVGVRGLIIVPSHELGNQIGKIVKDLIKLCSTDLRVCFLVGGMNMSQQFEHLAINPDIIVGTPGRILHHIKEESLMLQRVQVLVLDEADELFERKDLQMSLYQILAEMNRKGSVKDAAVADQALSTRGGHYQIVLMSATLGTRIHSFIVNFFRNPINVSIERKLPDHLKLQFVFCRATDKIPGFLYWVTQVRLDCESVIVFCSTVHHVSFLAELLRKIGIECCELGGSMDDKQRRESIETFKKNRMKVLVATDVAARGIDVNNLDYVFNFDFPSSPKLFVHRAGRTARRERNGTALSLITRDDVGYAMELMLFLGKKFAPGPEAPKDTAAADGERLGGFPNNINDERFLVSETIKHDATMERLARSMAAAESVYHKHRMTASKHSMTRGVELINTYGGCHKLADLCHPSFASHTKQMQKNTVSQVTGLDILKRETVKKEQKPDVETLGEEDNDEVTVEWIQNFRPTNKGRGVSAESASLVSNRLHESEMVRQLAAEGLGRTSANPYVELLHKHDSPATEETKQSGVQSRKKGKKTESNKMSKRQQVMEKLKTNMTVLSQPVVSSEELHAMQHKSDPLDILGDDFQSIQKGKSVKRWDAKKKRFVQVVVGRGGEKIRNEAGALIRPTIESKGLYKKWAAQSKLRIQKTGELEEAHLMAAHRHKMAEKFQVPQAAEEKAPSSQKEELLDKLKHVTRDLGLIEKIEKSVRLTHREERRMKKLSKLSVISTGTGPSGLAPISAMVKSIKADKARNAHKHEVQAARDKKAKRKDAIARQHRRKTKKSSS